ncbi:(-)-limonene synthase [Morus notabilis]|uniref:(-)-limonene synthase n=1 Tax=Morus notabilis TaxID=981085 RepID=W9RV45_9ROSA|nr:(-)-limonene synthase [Morus notabilis]
MEIILGCMDLDLALRTERPTATTENLNMDKIEKWDRSNHMSLMIMKRSIPEAFRGSVTESTNAKKFLKELEQYFAKNEKSEMSNLLNKLISIRYKAKGNIRDVGYQIEFGYGTVARGRIKIKKSYNASLIKHVQWADLSKCFLLEAKWYTSGHTPTFQEYLENGWVSIAAPIVLAIAYICVTNPLREEAIMLLAMEGYPSIIREASIIGRLTNDLSTLPFELEKGNVPTSIQCYMNEFGASEDEARQHIKLIIDESWKQNKRLCLFIAS